MFGLKVKVSTPIFSRCFINIRNYQLFGFSEFFTQVTRDPIGEKARRIRENFGKFQVGIG